MRSKKQKQPQPKKQKLPQAQKQKRVPQPSPKRQEPNRRDSPLAQFFSQYYPRFVYDPTKSASREFYRLCDETGWDRDDPQRREAHENFKDALVKEFNRIYGVDEDDLRLWQNLCDMLRIAPVPDNLHSCREAVQGIYVNLVDLVDKETTGESVRVFNTECDLSEYTKNTGKFFPKENAYAGGLLRYLLRHIMNPRSEASRRRSISRRR